MNKDCITFRSITPAQRAQYVLRQGGVETALQRTPRYMDRKGCGYCLRIRPGDRDRALGLLTRAGIEYWNVFPGDAGEKVVP